MQPHPQLGSKMSSKFASSIRPSFLKAVVQQRRELRILSTSVTSDRCGPPLSGTITGAYTCRNIISPTNSEMLPHAFCIPSLCSTTAETSKPRPPPTPKGTKAPTPKGTKSGGGGKGESTSSDEDIRKLRIQKAADLRQAGRNPYAYTFPRSHGAAELQAAHADLADGEERRDVQVAVAGRIMARRVMGKLAFCRLQDATGDIQASGARRRATAAVLVEIRGSGGLGSRTAMPGIALDPCAHTLCHLPCSFWMLTCMPCMLLQLYVDKLILEEGSGEGAFSDFKGLVDMGDIVGATGAWGWGGWEGDLSCMCACVCSAGVQPMLSLQASAAMFLFIEEFNIPPPIATHITPI
jgi:hypothetical protein